MCRAAPTAADAFVPKTSEAANALLDIMATTVIKVGFYIFLVSLIVCFDSFWF